MSAHPPPRLRRALALGTAAAFGLGGLFAAPAFAETAPEEAPTSGAAYEAQAKELLAEDAIQAVGRDKDGNVVVIKTSDASAEFDAFEAKYANVVVKEVAAPFESAASTDVVGGAGYYTEGDEGGFVCSIGFSAWSPEGDPAVVSAGHCTDDGANSLTALTLPSGDDAGGGNDETVALTEPLGTFGFSQYGGPGNTAGAENTTSVDISVIDVTNPALDLHPEVTDWTTAAADDLFASTTEISSVGKAAVGKPVSKSGRTTGLTSDATVDLVDGWAEVSGRIVYGFGVEGLVSDQGDSGGAIFQGEKAVGILSGGAPAEGGLPAITWGADLQAGLALTDGYTIMLAVDAPVLTSPADGAEIERGATISGTGPASTTIVVDPNEGETFEITTNASGAWSFPAPSTLGKYGFTLQSKKGFNLSEEAYYTVQVVPAPLKAPGISSPKDGSTVETEVTSIRGTGLPLAQITVTGDVEGTAVVGDNGVWSVPANLSYGEYSISVTQSSEGETSPVATSDFTVAPVAPSISTPADGDWFAAGDAPESTSGVGLAGATVTVAVNGKVVGTDEIPAEPTQEMRLAAAALPGDNWEVALANAIVTGDNVISVTQTVDGVTSAAATATVELRAAAGEGPVAGPGEGAGNGGGLAVTGGPDLLPIGIAAWLLIAGGIAAAVVVRKRRLVTED
ncbi:trypsin [Labedella gwakjiensis]|uniref:Trypsin n=1 Tax=Labedella gwakjiensis TaxID=390269 RepID=A0A2P8GUY0_9MICO|nr:S1 family peptidase [Labedella gwakjiensis]PSL37777.1 trypsin [Labedella gwakjiensis]